MPAYNFSPKFAEAVECGFKLQTIRKTDKGAKIGDTAHLFTGQRTPNCRKLGTGTITAVVPIVLFEDEVSIDGLPLFCEALNVLAHADGFATYAHMAEWFCQKYSIKNLNKTPLEGFIHAWTLD